MHEYYRNNITKLRKQMNNYLSLVRNDVEKIFGMPYDAVFEEIWKVYERDMLEKFPYIGGDDVSGTGNLTGCMFFIAISVAGKAYGLSTHDWGRLATTIYERKFATIPGFVKGIAAYLFNEHPGLVVKALQKKDRKNAANAAKHPGSFVTETQPPTEEFPIIYHNKVCPICDFCKQYGYMEYLPYMCNLDYVMLGAFGASLYREKTCATGDGYCDFKMKKGAPIPAVWPPHILDENDPLK